MTMPITDKPVYYQAPTAADEQKIQKEYDRFKKQQAENKAQNSEWRWYLKELDRVTSKEEKQNSEKSLFEGLSTFFSPNSASRTPLLQQKAEAVPTGRVFYPHKIRHR
jgi:ribosomal protein S20